MLEFKVLRTVYRIRFIRDNAKAIHCLSDIFYLLIALYRERRLAEFNDLKFVYFEMIDAFAQYGRSEARGTINDLLEMPWFARHRADVYRLITSFNRITQFIGNKHPQGVGAAEADDMNRAMGAFVEALKRLINFDDRDEARVATLRENPDLMNEWYDRICRSLASTRKPEGLPLEKVRRLDKPPKICSESSRSEVTRAVYIESGSIEYGGPRAAAEVRGKEKNGAFLSSISWVGLKHGR